MAIITLTADTDYSTLTVANGDTIDVNGFTLTFDVAPTETGVQVVDLQAPAAFRHTRLLQYRFKGRGDAVDVSGQNYGAATLANVTFEADGLRMTGGSPKYAQCDAFPVLERDFAVVQWVKFNTLTNWAPIWEANLVGNNNVRVFTFANGQVRWQRGAGYSDGPVSPTGAVVAGQWHLIVANWADKSGELFSDGVSVGALAAALVPSNAGLRVGSLWGNFPAPNMWCSDFLVLNGPMTLEEHEKLYRAGPDIPAPTNLVQFEAMQ